VFDAGQIEALIAPSLDSMGYRIVRVAFTGGKTRPTLQIMAERKDDAAMTVEDCSDISHSVSAILDVADPIESMYTLEISSPGIDRPLVRPSDYERWAGFDARIELQRVTDGRKRVQGKLLGLDGDNIKVMVGAETLSYPLSLISKAKLVMTDELLAATQPQNLS
jgi:ribosome maturation factor RimP